MMMAAQKDDQVRLYSYCHCVVIFLLGICKTIAPLLYPIVAGGLWLIEIEKKTSEYYIKRLLEIGHHSAPPRRGPGVGAGLGPVGSAARGPRPWVMALPGSRSQGRSAPLPSGPPIWRDFGR